MTVGQSFHRMTTEHSFKNRGTTIAYILAFFMTIASKPPLQVVCDRGGRGGGGALLVVLIAHRQQIGTLTTTETQEKPYCWRWLTSRHICCAYILCVLQIVLNFARVEIFAFFVFFISSFWFDVLCGGIASKETSVQRVKLESAHPKRYFVRKVKLLNTKSFP